MGETIPPCINMIILGYVANVSIGGLFIAGLLPAGVMALGLILVAMLTARRRGTHDREAVLSLPHSLEYIVRTVGGALTGIFLVVIIVGGIVGGVATPTEVSAVAVVYAPCRRWARLPGDELALVRRFPDALCVAVRHDPVHRRLRRGAELPAHGQPDPAEDGRHFWRVSDRRPAPGCSC